MAAAQTFARTERPASLLALHLALELTPAHLERSVHPETAQRLVRRAREEK